MKARERFRIAIVFFLAFCSAHAAAAQVYESAGEVYGDLGWSYFGDDEGSLGSGAAFGGGIGFRPLSRIGFELDIHTMEHKRAFSSGVRFEGRETFVSGNVLYYFSESKAQFYLLAGIGLLDSRRSSEFTNFEGPPEILHYRDKEFAYSFGAGVKRFITPRIALRPEFRFLASSPSFLNASRTSMAVSYHW